MRQAFVTREKNLGTFDHEEFHTHGNEFECAVTKSG